MVLPHVVVRFPDKYLDLFLQYHFNHLPDLSGAIEYTPKDLSFWKNTKNARNLKTALLKESTTMRGLCGKWLNTSQDFAMARYRYPAVTIDDERK